METVDNNLNISLEVYKQVMEEELAMLRTANQMLKIVNAQLRANLLGLQKETDQAYKQMSDINKDKIHQAPKEAKDMNNV